MTAKINKQVEQSLDPTGEIQGHEVSLHKFWRVMDIGDLESVYRGLIGERVILTASFDPQLGWLPSKNPQLYMMTEGLADDIMNHPALGDVEIKLLIADRDRFEMKCLVARQYIDTYTEEFEDRERRRRKKMSDRILALEQEGKEARAEARQWKHRFEQREATVKGQKKTILGLNKKLESPC